jgi:hypothetical protein
MPRTKLTKSVIGALPTPAKDVVYWDKECPGFGVKVTPKGRKVFVVLYRTAGTGSQILPASLPFLVGGMEQGWAFAWRSLMAAEIYVTILTGFGLGHLLHYGRELNAMDQVIGIMLVIVAIGLLADKLIFSPWEQFLHQRWGTGQF